LRVSQQYSSDNAVVIIKREKIAKQLVPAEIDNAATGREEKNKQDPALR
jgi:hypothetical protein